MNSYYTFELRDKSSAKVTTLQKPHFFNPILDYNDNNINRLGLKIKRLRYNTLSNLDTITISLGTNCNTNCQYCFQREFEEHNPSQRQINFTREKIPQFIERLKTVLTDCYQTSDVTSWKLRRIMLWGGEPLVYWRTIEQLVPELYRNFPTLVHCDLSTNGRLLAEDKLQFCVDNNIHIQISDDGISNSLRGIDIVTSNNTRDLIKKFIKQNDKLKVQIHSTITNNNPDVYKLTKSILQAYDYNINSILVVPIYAPAFTKAKTNTLALQRANWDILFDSTVRAYEQYWDWMFKHDLCNRVYRVCRFLNDFTDNTLSEYGTCSHAECRNLTVNCNCDVFGCRDIPFQYNKLADFSQFQSSRIVQYISEKFKPTLSKTRCIHCCFRSFCGGVCNLMSKDITEQLCSLYFLHSAAILNVCFDKVYNQKLSYINVDNVPLDDCLYDLITFVNSKL